MSPTAHPPVPANPALGDVYSVILAGGSGTRFWPASRRLKPKQLLAVAPGDSRCLLAAVVQRLEPVCPADHVVISTGKHLLSATQAALPQLPSSAFLGEPQAKNTAPCIAWATAKIAAQCPQAVIVVVPSDQHVLDEPAFAKALSAAIAQARQGFITTLGITPTRPETGYGYLQRGDLTNGGAFAVQRFVEKPDLATASEYLASGDYFWNSGIFVYRADVMLDALEQEKPDLRKGVERIVAASGQGPDLEAAETAEFFERCESVSIDYAVMEKQRDLRMVPCDAGWSDLGSWQAVWELSNKLEGNNASNRPAVFVDAQNNLVCDLDLPSSSSSGVPSDAIALVGVSDLCVIRSQGSLLVIPRQRTQDVRQVVELLQGLNLTHLL